MGKDTVPTIEVARRASGKYSLVLHRPGRPDSIVRAGITDHREARTRAKVWRDMLGYRLKDCRD